MTTFKVGDRVMLAAEAEHGGMPDRIGVVIDTSAVDIDGADVIAVDFPWSDRYRALPPTALELVDRPADPEAPDAVRAAAENLGQQIARSGASLLYPHDVLQHLIGSQAGEDMADPDIGKHQFTGRSDRPCELPGCGKPDRNPIHAINPPYRLVYVDDLHEGDELYLVQAPGRWERCTILERRDAHDCAHLRLRDSDGDQRGMQSPFLTLTPVPL